MIWEHFNGMLAFLPMIDEQLLAILCCPETKQQVSLIDEDTIQSYNELIASGQVKNRGGETVTEKIDGGLLREDGKFLYPIRQSIPIMLIDEALPCEE